jgi:hypothetical protein
MSESPAPNCGPQKGGPQKGGPQKCDVETRRRFFPGVARGMTDPGIPKLDLYALWLTVAELDFFAIAAGEPIVFRLKNLVDKKRGDA